MIETQQKKERLILVGVNTGNEQAARVSLEELGLLVRTAGAEPLDQVVQNLEHPNPATYVGSGKLDEIRILINSCDADGIVCDDELTARYFLLHSRRCWSKGSDCPGHLYR